MLLTIIQIGDRQATFEILDYTYDEFFLSYTLAQEPNKKLYIALSQLAGMIVEKTKDQTS